MAGYSFASNVNHRSTPNNNQKCSRFSTTSSFTPSHRYLKFNNTISTPKSQNKVMKNKNRQKMNTFQLDERRRFKKMLLEHMVLHDRHRFDHQKTSSIDQCKESAIISLSRKHSLFIPNLPLRKSISLIDLVKSKGLTAIPTIVPSVQHDTSSQNKPFSSTRRSSKLDLIQKNWKLPEKSNDFKLSVENKLSLLYTSSICNDKSVKNKTNIHDTQLYEKLNRVKIFKNDRESIISKIKLMFEPFISFNFYCKFKRYIPYIERDHEISERAKTIDHTVSTVPLTLEIKDELEEILNGENQLLVSAFSINIHTKDILTLNGTNWLNDAVIEFYLNLIVSRSQQKPKELPSVYAFSTYFFTRLSNGSAVGRWANKLDFFSYDLLLVPIHHANHWRLVVVDNERKCIEYYDSLGNEFRYCIDLLVQFLQNESFNKKKTELDLSQWQLVYRIPNIPKQENYYDCGVFTCKYAEYIARRAPLTFNQEHIPDFRKCMMYEIIHQKLLL